jgi:hypothetical protein
VDTDHAGVQRFHARPVPPIGRTGILIGPLASAIQLYSAYPSLSAAIFGIVARGTHAFASGLIEN